MSKYNILNFKDLPVVKRGKGVESVGLIRKELGSKVFSSGITNIPSGVSIPLHSHNVDEQITILEGRGVAEVEGKVYEVETFDTTFIRGGIDHRFINTSDSVLKILWIYASTDVTRTYTVTGETVPQLTESEYDNK